MCIDSSSNSHVSPSIHLGNTNHPIAARQEEVIADLTWKQEYLSLTFDEWVGHAQTGNIDIKKQLKKIEQIYKDKPGLNSRQQTEVWLLYETTMLNVVTSQIVRRIAKTHVQRTAAEARAMPELAHLRDLIDGCERFLMKRLPSKLPQIAPVETAIIQMREVAFELEKMTKNILSKAKKPSSI